MYVADVCENTLKDNVVALMLPKATIEMAHLMIKLFPRIFGGHDRKISRVF